MRKLDTSPIAPGVGFPVKKGTLDFLQQSYGEIISELVQELYPTATVESQVTAVRGCTQTPSGSNTTLSAGAIYVAGALLNPPQPNGELFLLPSSQTAATTGAILTIGTTYYTGDGSDADPVLFSNNNTYSVHDIRTLVLTNGTSATAGYVCDLSALQYVQTPFAYTSNLVKHYKFLGDSSVPISSSVSQIVTLGPYTFNSDSMTILFSCQMNYGSSLATGDLNFNITVGSNSDYGSNPNVGGTAMNGANAFPVAIVAYCSYTAGDIIAILADSAAGVSGDASQVTVICECFDAH